MVNADSSISMNTEDKDQLAVRCGVVLAELALTAKTAKTEKIVSNLNLLKEGFTKLGAGKKFLKTIDELSSSVQTGAKSKDDLLKEMDRLAGIMVPELKKELGDWVVPLRTSRFLVERERISYPTAIDPEQKYDVATRLLKQPHVIDYFLKYVRREGKNKAPDEVIAQLGKNSSTLKDICKKSSFCKRRCARH